LVGPETRKEQGEVSVPQFASPPFPAEPDRGDRFEDERQVVDDNVATQPAPLPGPFEQS
jgi:hypothetical protein